MKTNHLLLLFVISFFVFACKQEAAQDQQESVQAQEAPGQGASAPAAHDAAPQDVTGGHDYTFLTDKLFHYKNSFSGKKDGEPLFKNEWIDFASDGTFKAGKLKEQTHTGKWAYNNDTKLLFLRPDNTTFNMSEWKVMYNEKMMVWLGTSTYGNNSIQVQLVRSDVLP